jgi:hypothetical protein
VSVRESDVIDAIGIDGRGQVVLTIADHLDWDDEDAHLLALQEKLNGYLRFIESGQLDEVYPDATGRDRVISLTLMVKAPRSAEQFLSRVAHTLQAAGIGFRHEYRG